MKFLFISILLFPLICGNMLSQVSNHTFELGERLEFNVKVGLFSLAKASAEVVTLIDPYMNKAVYHAVVKAETSNLADFVVNTRDRYESFIDTQTLKPLLFTENIKEGSYSRKGYILFTDSVATDNKMRRFTMKEPHFDVVSMFYYLRNYISDTIPINDTIRVWCLLNGDKIDVAFVYQGTEKIKTHINGKMECMRFKPIIPPGNVFKEDNLAAVWITNDGNKIPVKVEIELVFASVRVWLENTYSLKYPY